MFLHVTACIIVYLTYLFLTQKSKNRALTLTNAHPYFKYLVYPAFLIYFIQIFFTKTLFASALTDTSNLTYTNLIGNTLYPFYIIVIASILKIFLTNKFNFKYLTLVLFILVASFVKSFMAGSKAGILELILFFGLVYFYKYGLRLKVAIAIIILLIPSAFFFVSMANIRFAIAENNMWQDLSISQKIGFLYEKSLTLKYSENFSKLSETIAKRLHGIFSLSRFIERTPAVYPYYNGASYSRIFTGIIPRVLWPAKSINDFPNQISYNYFDYAFTTNMATFIWGEPYLNFGIMGIYAFALIMGLILVFFEKILNIFRNDLYIYTFCLLIFYSFIRTESGFAVVIPNMVAKIIFFSVVFLLLSNLENKKNILNNT